MIQFEKIMNDQIHLSFSEEELDKLLLLLEKHCSEDEQTKRLDALSFVFQKRKRVDRKLPVHLHRHL